MEGTPRKPAKRRNRNWDESYFALCTYYKNHGNTNVPRRYAQDTALGKWVGRQRTYKHNLTEEQRQKLQVIGFAYQGAQAPEALWNSNFEELKKYKAKRSAILA